MCQNSKNKNAGKIINSVFLASLVLGNQVQVLLAAFPLQPSHASCSRATSQSPERWQWRHGHLWTCCPTPLQADLQSQVSVYILLCVLMTLVLRMGNSQGQKDGLHGRWQPEGSSYLPFLCFGPWSPACRHPPPSLSSLLGGKDLLPCLSGRLSFSRLHSHQLQLLFLGKFLSSRG